MMHLTSSSSLSLFHIFPLSRTTHGMEASTMTSDGTCKLVIPLSLLTMANHGRFSYTSSMSSNSCLRVTSGSSFILS